MDTFGLKDAFRVDIDDVAAPYLWSDELVFAYMDDAQKMFCRLTNGISDSTSSLCQIDIDVGEAFADLDPRILKIRRLQRNSDARPLRVINVEDCDAEGIRLDDRTGPVETVVTGMEEHKVRWVKIPLAADTASLTVFRLPLRAITAVRSRLEIDEQHHRALLLWMKHLAYAKQDTDTYNDKKSQAMEQAFRDYCFAAKIEQDRLRHKIRRTAYGGL